MVILIKYGLETKLETKTAHVTAHVRETRIKAKHALIYAFENAPR